MLIKLSSKIIFLFMIFVSTVYGSDSTPLSQAEIKHVQLAIPGFKDIDELQVIASDIKVILGTELALRDLENMNVKKAELHIERLKKLEAAFQSGNCDCTQRPNNQLESYLYASYGGILLYLAREKVDPSKLSLGYKALLKSLELYPDSIKGHIGLAFFYKNLLKLPGYKIWLVEKYLGIDVKDVALRFVQHSEDLLERSQNSNRLTEDQKKLRELVNHINNTLES